MRLLDTTVTQPDIIQTLTNSMTPKFAISYLRVSTRSQAGRGGGADEGFSIPAQREANKKKALSMGAMIGKEFVDRGASAKSADRPELKKMLEYIKENADRVDYVIVHKVDRLARNRGDDVDITRALCEAGVQLVSASESIDNTPSGMLLHGIMSSIAEFYSKNLANEVMKGMNEKAKNGGTPSKAPIGYTNVRRIDDKGREERTIEVDVERAGFIRTAFSEYATGKWTVLDLADHLALRGFMTRATPKIPTSPVNRGTLNKILVNPYYKGVVVYNGVQYPGNHMPLVDEQTWQTVQDILLSHYNGERNREHPHFLKGTIYCKNCGSRMIVHYAKSRSGIRYPYFICSGRHSKRQKDCSLRALLIEEIEYQIEQLYEKISLPREIRDHLEKWVSKAIEKSKLEFESEQTKLSIEKDKLERKRKKLLEAHYNDAIPLDLLKTEQSQISKALAAIDSMINVHDAEYILILKNLETALDLIEDCGRTYRLADEHIKKLLNQAIFSRILIEDGGTLTPEYTKPFDSLITPIEDSVAKYNTAKAAGCSKLEELLQIISNHISNFFGCGLKKILLVEMRGIEPLTS